MENSKCFFGLVDCIKYLLFKYSLKYYWRKIRSFFVFLIYIIISLIIFTIVGVEIYILSQAILTGKEPVFAIDNLFPASIVATGLVFAYYQFRHRNDNDRKHNTMQFIERATKENTEKRRLLNQKMGYTDRQLKNENPLTVEEVHELICEGGKSPRDKGTPEDCTMTEKGREVRGYIFDLLNLYEQIGISVHTLTFDETVLREFFESIILKNYEFYHIYLYHLRTVHNDALLGTYFEWLAKKWSK